MINLSPGLRSFGAPHLRSSPEGGSPHSNSWRWLLKLMEVNQKERAGLRIQLVMRPYIENIFMTSGRQRGSHMATGMMSSSSAGPGCQRRVQEGGADLFLASGWVHCGTHGRWSPVTADLQAAAVGSLRSTSPLFSGCVPSSWQVHCSRPAEQYNYKPRVGRFFDKIFLKGILFF